MSKGITFEIFLKTNEECLKIVIVQKLLYGLEGAWINAAGKRKLDGFHARCLRKVLGVPHAYYSRVSNAEVLRRAGYTELGVL